MPRGGGGNAQLARDVAGGRSRANTSKQKRVHAKSGGAGRSMQISAQKKKKKKKKASEYK